MHPCICIMDGNLHKYVEVHEYYIQHTQMLKWFSFRKQKKVNFEYVLDAIQRPADFLLLNTLPANEQECLIVNTLSMDAEEKIINEWLNKYQEKIRTIVIYGKNAADTTAETKQEQLLKLGISESVVYAGGMFEWMLLQDIYGEKEFPTTKKVVDILKFK